MAKIKEVYEIYKALADGNAAVKVTKDMHLQKIERYVSEDFKQMP